MTVPHITIEQANAIWSNYIDKKESMEIFNGRIDSYNKANEPTCQVRNDDTGKTETITREAAKLLQAETKDVCDWFVPEGMDSNARMFDFRVTGIYTYKLKANLVKLDGELMTREAAIAKYEAVKDKRDVWYKSENTNWLTGFGERFAMHSEGETIEYQLRAKPLKQVSWKDVPVGVAVICPLDGEICEYKGVNGDVLSYYSSANFEMYEAEPNPFDDTQRLELAPASEQPWIAVQDDNPPAADVAKQLGELGFDVITSGERYRITGLAEGWVLK